MASRFRQWYDGKRTGIGSFEHSLYECFFKADGSNRRILIDAFKDQGYFDEDDAKQFGAG